MIKVSAHKLNIKLKSPISISFHTWYYSENVLVTLGYKHWEGTGEAAPFKPITGDSQEEVLEDLKKFRFLRLNPEKDSLAKLHELLDKKTKCQTLKAAVDFAYHDLVGKIKNKPVYALYSPKPKLVNNSVTVFIKRTLTQTAQETTRLLDLYPELQILKIKLHGTEADIEMVKAIKKKCPKNLSFILDANQGFKDPKKAVEVLNQIGKILEKVILVEEPCPKGELTKLKYVKDNIKGMLVFADESAATVQDAKKVIRHNAAHGINIKLQKAGGIYPGKVIAKLCQKANYKIMVGSMLDGSMATTASTHFAVSTPNLILSDLDMDLDLPKFTSGQAMFEKGKRRPSGQAGLGVTLEERELNKFKKTKNIIYTKIRPAVKHY